MSHLRTTRDYERAAAETIVHLPKLIADEFGLSTSEARRLIATGAVRLDDARVEAANIDIRKAILEGKTLTVGKRRSVEL